MALVVDPDNLSEGATGTDEVEFDTGLRTITLTAQDQLDATDGVTMQCLYSFCKIQWKDDPNGKNLAAFDFPIVAVTPEQFELVDGWTFGDDTSRKLIRSGGWSEIDGDGILDKQLLGVITLGTFEDTANDTAYYQFGTDQAVDDSVDFDFAGPVNEPIEAYTNVGNVDTCTFATATTITRGTGSFITDGFKVGGQVTIVNATTGANNGTETITAVAATTLTAGGASWTTEADTTALLAVDNRAAITLKVRVRDGDPEGKLYGSVALADIGITGSTTNKVERFPLANATDLKITETDANIDALTPYTQIEIRYFDGTFTKDVDGTTNRSFGAAIDVGTHSGIDGSFSAAGTVLTSADGGIHASNFDGGTLTLYDGTDEGETHDILSTTATTVTIENSTFTSTDSAVSFSCQRATGVTATAEEIYEKVQRQLRRTTNINSNSTATQDVIGRTADDMLLFVGDTLKTQRITNAANANTAQGVFIEGFDSNDTNRIVLVDDTNTEYTYPFVAAGTISFNQNLQDDSGPAEYWMYYTYTTRTAVSDLVVNSAGTLTSAGTEFPTTVGAGDYLTVSGLTGVDAPMNGVYVASGTPTSGTIDVARYDGVTMVTTAGTDACNLDQDPIDSPDAIIVKDNAAADIQGTISGPSVSFDYDYDNNIQGGAGNPRTAGTPAEVTLVGIGLDTAQHVVSTGTITQATGLAFSLVSGLERNYDNP